MTFTGAIGSICMFPLRAIIRTVAWRCASIRTCSRFVGVLINVAAAWALGLGRFMLAGVIMIVANIFDFIDGKVAHQLQLQSRFGAFWDSTLDRFSDLALLVGLIYLYSKLGRTDYVMIAALTLIFSIMTSYARARAESLVEKCKVGFMERPERIVLFMIGAFTNRMAGVLWVILVLSILAVANRIYYTYLALNGLPLPRRDGVTGLFWRAFFWTDERTTLPYDAVGDRDPRLRLAHAARVARRSDGARTPGCSPGFDRPRRRPLDEHGRSGALALRRGPGVARRSTDCFLPALTASRLFFSASIRFTTFGGASTAGATTSSPAIFASMIRCSPSRYSSL